MRTYTFESHPHISPSPAPWTLTGDGYILVYRFPKAFRQAHPALFPNHLGKPVLSLSTVMLVDYRSSGAGPYREVLFIPGLYRFPQGTGWTISQIYVSTWDSIVNGHVNWGIPKEHAEWEIDTPEKGVERIRISCDGTRFLDMTLAAKGPFLPVHTVLSPPFLRGVMQHHGESFFHTVPGGKGRLGPAKVKHSETTGKHFPDLNEGRLLAAFKAKDFSLRFPEARVQALS